MTNRFLLFNRLFHAVFALFLLLSAGCVKPKVFRAEQSARTRSEARETVLNRELTDRKKESATLISQVEDLARQLGAKEKEVEGLELELSTRTQRSDESTSKLATAKLNLEKEVDQLKMELSRRKKSVDRYLGRLNARKLHLDSLEQSIRLAYASLATDKPDIRQENEAVVLVFSDKSLFDATGMQPSAAARTTLGPLTAVLAMRPELDVAVEAHTDNVLPKDKTVKDTWDWSLMRAVQVVRFLIRDFNLNANQFTPVGKGEYYPIASNATPDGRMRNRRTVMRIQPVLPLLLPLEE